MGGRATIYTPIRGGAQEAFDLHENAKQFEIGIHWELTEAVNLYKGNYRIKVGLSEKTLTLFHEHIAVGNEEYNSELPEVGEDVVANLFAPVVSNRDHKNLPNAAPVLRTWLKNFYFLNLAPSLMRDYVPKNRPEIGMRGENLSAILFKLASNPDHRRTVLDWVQELCPQEIVDFDFIETKLGDVLLAVKEPNGVIISARSMSDGTLRFLAIIVAMLSGAGYGFAKNTNHCLDAFALFSRSFERRKPEECFGFSS